MFPEWSILMLLSLDSYLFNRSFDWSLVSSGSLNVIQQQQSKVHINDSSNREVLAAVGFCLLR